MNIQEIKSIINEFGISMPKLAEKLGISNSSFKKKIEPEKYTGYSFNNDEKEKLEKEVLYLSERLKISIKALGV